jgi:potassium-transporting ATPase KdpC subunit
MLRQMRPAILMVLVFTVLTGLLFPAAVTAMARVFFPRQAGGSLVERDGKVIGSELIGQTFTSPRYFHLRPSAAGSGYDGASSGGTNLGPTSDKLINGAKGFDGVKQLAAAYRTENGLPANAVLPADAVTRSASGLDPHISPANAALQAPRVARARGLSVSAVQRIVAENTQGRTLGVLGEPRVNVLRLNLALDGSQQEGRNGTHPGRR